MIVKKIIKNSLSTTKQKIIEWKDNANVGNTTKCTAYKNRKEEREEKRKKNDTGN